MKVKSLLLAAAATMIWAGDSQAASKVPTVKIEQFVHECKVRTSSDGVVKLKPKLKRVRGPKQDLVRLQRPEKSLVLGACFKNLTEQFFTAATSSLEVTQ